MEEKDTKTKILEAAHSLFGERGFGSVSVREISKVAGVNISAINYHFESKESLYLSVISNCIDEMRQTIQDLYDSVEDCDTKQLATLAIDYFIKEAQSLKLTFKMSVLDSHIFPQEAMGEDSYIGPPGGRILFDAIQKEKEDAKEEDIIWAVRTIFSLIVHNALIVCSKCSYQDDIRRLGPEEIKTSVCRAIDLILADI